MSTPSIQTLITQAQQVLNLKSSNEIRATLAAILANANVGTPLNPNLTTQQLWDEFYEIVRQPSDDIMSIITDQMMRMVFSPPAPGGAGADKQVIFNDSGVLAGDAGLVYNKTTDALTIAGPVNAASATITGDLTVRTTGLIVNTTGVGVNITPSVRLHASDSDNTANGTLRLGSAAIYGQIKNSASSTGKLEFTSVGTGVNGGYNFSIEGQNAHRIEASGVFSWFDGAGGARMTLNSTGLGVGIVPSLEKLQVNGGIVLSPPATPATLATNGQLTVNATSNTNLRFSYRGSDGTTRVANLTLA